MELNLNSQAERVGWVEADLRTLTLRLESLERSVEGQRHGAADNQLKVRHEREEINAEIAALRNDLSEYRAANEHDKRIGFTFIAERLAWHQLVLGALGLISLAEAVALLVLWRR